MIRLFPADGLSTAELSSFPSRLYTWQVAVDVPAGSEYSIRDEPLAGLGWLSPNQGTFFRLFTCC